jgi:hypothetical protein
MLALTGQTDALQKLEFYNRNQNWQEQRSTDGVNEKLVYTAWEIRDELKILEARERECTATKEYGLTLRARRTGFEIRTYADLQLLKDEELFWKKDLKDVAHKCRRMDTIRCIAEGCHATEKTESIKEFLKHRLEAYIQNPGQVHRCTVETARIAKGCEFFSFPLNQKVPLFADTSQFLIATASWFICLETGKMHWCNGAENCDAMSLTKEDGVTVSISCVISGYAKSQPVSYWTSWDGITFYSASRLRQIQTDMSNKECSDIGGQENEGLMDEGYDFEDFPEEEDAENAVTAEYPAQGDEMLDEGSGKAPKEELLGATDEGKKKKRKFNGLLDEDDVAEAPVDDEGGEEGVPTPVEDEGENGSEDEPDGQRALMIIPAPIAKRQRITDIIGDKTGRNIENPLQVLKQQITGADCTIQELALVLAQEKILAEEERIAAQKEAELRKTQQPTRFAFKSGNKDTRVMVANVQSSITGWKDKKRARETTTAKKRNSRRVYTLLSREEKMTQFLARGTPEIATMMLRYLLGAETKNRISTYRLRAAIEVANLSVVEMNRENTVPFITQVGCWCEKISELVGGFLENEPITLDLSRYAHVILSHWREASTSPLVTQVFNLHKKKKRKPLDFILHCIGVIYNMAEGGVIVRVKLTGNIPEALLTNGERLRKAALEGRLVREFPDERATLAGPILKPQFIQDLSQVYRDGYQFTDSSYTEAISTVKQCYETRHLDRQADLYDAVDTWVRDRERGELVPTLESLYINYCCALRPPHSSRAPEDDILR